jgi:2-phospho-L-lactate/phosphoenolpyruvate guanylyltransferase
MPNCFIVPTRGFEAGKSRLAPVLSPAQRGELNRHLLGVVLAAIAGACRAQDRILLVSPDRAVLEFAARCGAQGLSEPASIEAIDATDREAGFAEVRLNRALEYAAQHARRAGARGLIVVPADLPCVQREDLQALAEAVAGVDRVAIAPDLGGQGTNGLAMPADAPLGFRFGPHSFERHAAAARAAGLALAILERPGLAMDLDTPRDWLRLRSHLPLRAA